VIIFLGPNHQAKEVRQMIQESEYYGKNLNIIIILISNLKERKVRTRTLDEEGVLSD
jgi:hypothetical protein